MIFCSRCIKYFPAVTEYFNHLEKPPHKMKRGTPQSTPFHCPFVSCNRFFTFKQGLVKHCKTDHAKKFKSPKNLVCVKVSGILGGSSGNVSHDAIQLELERNAVSVAAPPDLATTDFSFEESFNVNTEASPDTCLIEKCVSAETGVPCDVPMTDISQKIKEKIVNFFALVNSYPGIPHSFIQLITDNLISTCSDINDIFLKKISELQKQSPSGTSKKILSDCIKLYDFIDTTFATFKSVYRQVKFFEKEGLYIKPKKQRLRYRLKMRKKKGRYAPTPVEETSVVVSMREVLRKFLSQDNVLDNILEHKKKLESEKVFISNIIQGDRWREIPSRKEGEILPLSLFNDDFEPDNALGGHAGTNKINGSYFSIACLPPQIKSSLNCIFLAMLTKASNKKYCGNKVTFKPIIDELKYLHKNGIIVRTSGLKEVRIFFQLATFIGDNLGLNGILGFVENFSKSNYCCRICLADLTQRRTLKVEKTNLLRTVEKYDEQVRLNDPATTGIKENCSFNELPNFHLLRNPTVDITHDIFEGVAKFDILFILKTYIYTYRSLTVADLNGRISRFPFGSADMSNKPPLFLKHCFKKKTFNISASECACLLKYLGLLIGDLVKPEHSVWQLYIALRRIVDIVLSPSLHKESVHLLRSYVEEHHGIYIDQTKNKLSLKYHNLTHYPNLILKNGPLRDLSCIRYDGKHKSLKKTSNAISSRRNVCLSVAKREQLLLSFNLFSNKYAKDNLKWGSTKSNSSFKLLSSSLITPIPDPLLKEGTVKTSWVEVNGTRYSPGVTLYVDIDERSSLPLFAELSEIYVSGTKKIYFRMKNLQTVGFNETLYAYRVVRTDSESIFQYDDVHDYQLHSVVPVKGGDLYVSLLYNS